MHPDLKTTCDENDNALVSRPPPLDGTEINWKWRYGKGDVVVVRVFFFFPQWEQRRDIWPSTYSSSRSRKIRKKKPWKEFFFHLVQEKTKCRYNAVLFFKVLLSAFATHWIPTRWLAKLADDVFPSIHLSSFSVWFVFFCLESPRIIFGHLFLSFSSSSLFSPLTGNDFCARICGKATSIPRMTNDKRN